METGGAKERRITGPGGMRMREHGDAAFFLRMDLPKPPCSPHKWKVYRNINLCGKRLQKRPKCATISLISILIRMNAEGFGKRETGRNA